MKIMKHKSIRDSIAESIGELHYTHNRYGTYLVKATPKAGGVVRHFPMKAVSFTFTFPMGFSDCGKQRAEMEEFCRTYVDRLCKDKRYVECVAELILRRASDSVITKSES